MMREENDEIDYYSPKHGVFSPSGSTQRFFSAPPPTQSKQQPVLPPTTNPTWTLGKDPDPMMQALLENLISIETSLIELRTKAQVFQDSIGHMCKNMQEQSSSYLKLCVDEPTLAPSMMLFNSVIKSGINESAFDRLKDHLELKVFEPIKANLSVIEQIKKRAYSREILRKRIKGKSTAASNPEFANITVILFEELTALKKHRYDFIRVLFEGLKQTQKRFFSEVFHALDSPDFDSFSRQNINRQVFQDEIQVSKADAAAGVATSSIDASNHIQSNSPSSPVPKREIILAMPLRTNFDPSADQVNADSAPAFSRFKRDDDESSSPASVRRKSISSPIRGRYKSPSLTGSPLSGRHTPPYSPGSPVRIKNLTLPPPAPTPREETDGDSDEFDVV